MKTRIILFLLVAIPALGWSQGSVSGKVYNNDQEPLAGATVSISESYKGTSTNNNGVYQIRNLMPGRYIIEARYIGFETVVDSVEVKDGEESDLNFTLPATTFISEEVVISATRAGDKTPTTYTNLDKEEIEDANFGQDLPYLLEFTPSAVVTSDAGAGVGYTGIRIRGSDQTRINATVNGIPVNDAESHGVFWVNMPDFASSVENIQVQRGVGTSTNGAAAFGASLNIQTNALKEKAYAEVENAYGSFNTRRHTVKAGTGLIDNKFSVDARLSQIASDGYIDRASSDLKSYYLAGSWHGKNSLLQVNVFGGHEVTYQSWNGISEDQLTEDRTFNSAGMYTDAEGNVRFYDNEVDNYQQHHYQLHFSHRFSSKLNMNVSGHYTRGFGYYEQYRQEDDFSTYQLDTLFIGGDTINSTDLIRRRWLDNHFYGGVFSVNYDNQGGLKVSFGGGWNAYDGDHYGEIIWARFASQTGIRDRYYDNFARKTDAHTYLKANYQIGKFNVFADVQYRRIDYQFEGLNVVNEEAIVADQVVHFDFLNPKAGLMFDLNDRNNLYATFGIAHREPVRRDFTESTPESRPQPEQLRNLEVGYRHKGKEYYINANYYLMDYQDQLVLSGQINDVGGYTRVNIPRSYRTGIELEGSVRLHRSLSIGANAAFSQNKIPAFTEYVDDYDEGGQLTIEHSNTDIAFSPSVIAGGQVRYEPVKGLSFDVMPRYVGEQFLDNTSNSDRMLPSYFLTNVRAHYTIKDVVFREMTLGILVYNLFDNLYESNGYTFSYIYEGEQTTENYYYPQAGRNFLVSLSLKM